jgi:NAD(P)-dependent dehydrogenase (short-subunit alcohol dehydrogenase family)
MEPTRTYIVTGGNTGLGYQCSRFLGASGGMVRDNPEMNRRVAEMTALRRAGQPDDIGPMIAALLSEDNRWINGQRIEASGGMAL